MRSKFMGTLGVLVVALALAALASTSALAAGAPTAETRAATSIGESGATLVGQVNPNGAEATYWFEYGTTTSYGTKSRNKTTLTEVTANSPIIGLAVNTTYHYRLVVKNSFGTAFGADETFKTVPVPPEAVLTKGGTKLAMIGEGSNAVIGWGGSSTVACESQRVELEFTSPKQVEAVMHWRGCRSGSHQCTNGSEEVTSEILKGSLGYTNKAKKEVGLVLEGKSSNVWASKFTCVVATASITGALAGDLTVTINKNIPETSLIPLTYYRLTSDEQQAGELHGQLDWPNSTTLFGLEASFELFANHEYEIQA